MLAGISCDPDLKYYVGNTVSFYCHLKSKEKIVNIKHLPVEGFSLISEILPVQQAGLAAFELQKWILKIHYFGSQCESLNHSSSVVSLFLSL